MPQHREIPKDAPHDEQVQPGDSQPPDRPPLDDPRFVQNARYAKARDEKCGKKKPEQWRSDDQILGGPHSSPVSGAPAVVAEVSVHLCVVVMPLVVVHVSSRGEVDLRGGQSPDDK